MRNTIRLLLPALIPSWRFFDTIAPSPRIEYATLQAPGETPIIWQEFRPKPQHISLAAMLGHLFYNPRRNESLYLTSCAERILENPTAHSIREITRRIIVDTHAPYVQFHLILVTRDAKELVYTSPVQAAAQ